MYVKNPANQPGFISHCLNKQSTNRRLQWTAIQFVKPNVKPYFLPCVCLYFSQLHSLSLQLWISFYSFQPHPRLHFLSPSTLITVSYCLPIPTHHSASFCFGPRPFFFFKPSPYFSSLHWKPVDISCLTDAWALGRGAGREVGESGSLSLSMICAQLNRSGSLTLCQAMKKKQKKGGKAQTGQKGGITSLDLIGRGSSLFPLR